jgi:hypothetical protein
VFRGSSKIRSKWISFPLLFSILVSNSTWFVGLAYQGKRIFCV